MSKSKKAKSAEVGRSATYERDANVQVVTERSAKRNTISVTFHRSVHMLMEFLLELLMATRRELAAKGTEQSVRLLKVIQVPDAMYRVELFTCMLSSQFQRIPLQISAYSWTHQFAATIGLRSPDPARASIDGLRRISALKSSDIVFFIVTPSHFMEAVEALSIFTEHESEYLLSASAVYPISVQSIQDQKILAYQGMLDSEALPAREFGSLKSFCKDRDISFTVHMVDTTSAW